MRRLFFWRRRGRHRTSVPLIPPLPAQATAAPWAVAALPPDTRSVMPPDTRSVMPLDAPKVKLGFADGAEVEIDPGSSDGRALSRIAEVLMATADDDGT